jgi:hypothetical protein
VQLPCATEDDERELLTVILDELARITDEALEPPSLHAPKSSQ